MKGLRGGGLHFGSKAGVVVAGLLFASMCCLQKLRKQTNMLLFFVVPMLACSIDIVVSNVRMLSEKSCYGQIIRVKTHQDS